MKKYRTIILSIMCILSLVGCGKKEQVVPDTPNAMVASIIYEGSLYRTTGKEIPAEVDESAIVGEISCVVPLTQLPTKDGEANFGEIGDPYAITSDGLLVKMNHEWVIFELYENEKTEVNDTKVVKEASEETEQRDLIPMVMVNGELYLDTGKESTVEARCGMMDGEITSTVDGTEKPTKDNESNFGTGYGYQFGSQEGLIEIYMNDKWWVFATEKVLASSELMIDPVAPVT